MDNSSTIAQLTDDLIQATQKIQAQKAGLVKAAQTIELVTEIVKLSASLVQLAAAA